MKLKFIQEDGFGYDDDDYEMDPETEASLHFGGGFQPKMTEAGAPDEAEPQARGFLIEVADWSLHGPDKARSFMRKPVDHKLAKCTRYDRRAIIRSGGVSSLAMSDQVHWTGSRYDRVFD